MPRRWRHSSKSGFDTPSRRKPFSSWDMAEARQLSAPSLVNQNQSPLFLNAKVSNSESNRSSWTRDGILSCEETDVAGLSSSSRSSDLICFNHSLRFRRVSVEQTTCRNFKCRIVFGVSRENVILSMGRCFSTVRSLRSRLRITDFEKTLIQGLAWFYKVLGCSWFIQVSTIILW